MADDILLSPLPSNTKSRAKSRGGSPEVETTIVGIDLDPAGTETLMAGKMPVHGDVIDGNADAGNAVKVGGRAVAHGSQPTAQDAGDRISQIFNRHGMPFIACGHPNVISREYEALAAGGAVSNVSLGVTVGTGEKMVVTQLMLTAANGNTAFPQVRIGFGATTTPAAGSAGIVGSHPGVPAGGGFSRGDGSGVLAIGGDGEELRITHDAPTGGSIRVLWSYYIVES